MRHGKMEYKGKQCVIILDDKPQRHNRTDVSGQAKQRNCLQIAYWREEKREFFFPASISCLLNSPKLSPWEIIPLHFKLN